MELDLGNSTRANVSLLGHLSTVQRVFRDLRRCGRPGRVALFLRAFVRACGLREVWLNTLRVCRVPYRGDALLGGGAGMTALSGRVW